MKYFLLIFLLVAAVIGIDALAAEKKISELNALTNANFASNDLFVIVDSSVSQTMKTTVADLDNRYFKNNQVLSVASGGTGVASFTNNAVLTGSGTAVNQVSTGASGTILFATGGQPSFRSLMFDDVVSALGYAPAELPIDLSSEVTGDLPQFRLEDSGVVSSTYTKVTVSSQGTVTSGALLSESDIPSLQTTKITSGVFTVPFGGTGVSSVTTGDLLIGSGSALTKLPIGTSGHILTVSGVTAVWAANTASGSSSSLKDIQSFTGSATITTAYDNISVSSSAVVTLTLPAAASATGKVFVFTLLSGTGAASQTTGSQAILSPTSGTICEKTSIKLTGVRDSISVYSDGTRWIGIEKDSCWAEHEYAVAPDCTAATCTTFTQTGFLISQTRSGTGTYANTWLNGTFSSRPFCTFHAWTTAGTRIIRGDSAVSSTGINPLYIVETTNGGSSDAGINVKCRGPR